ncbi:hypothetical protein KRX19_11480 [Cardiobacteriaceae bacterium TAE3-ERU3]|nr:hypothetical protein [Cardiobacteriaceae bacterium TAE3-ERU3]
MKVKSFQRPLEFKNQEEQKAVYSTSDLRSVIHDQTKAAFASTINRAVSAGVLHRVTRGLFVFTGTTASKSHISTQIVETFRPNAISYISLELALSMWSVISQIPFCATLMTTGPSGKIDCPIYGRFYFSHTTRDVGKDIRNKRIIVYSDRLPLAKPDIALRDLKSVGRNTHLVDMEAYQEALKEAS